MKNIFVSTETFQKVNTTHKNGEKNLQIMYLIMDLYLEYIKNSCNSTIEK